MPDVIQDWLHRWRYRRAIRNIRSGFAFFGHSLDGLTDEDIERSVFNYQQSIRNVGITVAEAAEAFRRVAETSGFAADDIARLRFVAEESH